MSAHLFLETNNGKAICFRVLSDISPTCYKKRMLYGPIYSQSGKSFSSNVEQVKFLFSDNKLNQCNIYTFGKVEDYRQLNIL